jgi:surfactin synthase thioesterase subunit
MHISHVIISASKDPATLTDECICPDKGNKHHLSDGELFDYFVSIGGLLEGVHPDILRVLLPIARSDYKLFENYLFKDPRIILATPMTTFFGSADEPETLACIVKWAGYTTKSTRNVSFDGGNHFYFVDEKHRERVLQEIVNICAAAANE